eukprot:6207852-Pleurochrysis_carterae.AAC.1
MKHATDAYVHTGEEEEPSHRCSVPRPVMEDAAAIDHALRVPPVLHGVLARWLVCVGSMHQAGDGVHHGDGHARACVDPNDRIDTSTPNLMRSMLTERQEQDEWNARQDEDTGEHFLILNDAQSTF